MSTFIGVTGDELADQEPTQFSTITFSIGQASEEKGSDFFKLPSYAPVIQLLKEREEECRSAISDTHREAEVITRDLERAHKRVVELKRKLTDRDQSTVERQDELKSLVAARSALESLAAHDTQLVQA